MVAVLESTGTPYAVIGGVAIHVVVLAGGDGEPAGNIEGGVGVPGERRPSLQERPASTAVRTVRPSENASTLPSLLRARLWASPAATATTPVSPGTGTGLVAPLRAPQAQTVPFFLTARL